MNIQEMTIEQMKEQIRFLQDAIEELQADPAPKRIKAAVMFYFDLSEKDLKRKRRFVELSYPRQILCYLLKTETKVKLIHMARDLGQHHSTILKGLRKIKDLISIKDDEVLHDLQRIKQNMIELRWVKEKNPLEYRDKKGQRKYWEPTGYKGKKIVLKPFVRPEAQYTNISGYINLKSKLEKVV